MKNSEKIVQFKHWKCKLEFGKYQNDRTSISLIDTEDNGPVATATVNLDNLPLPANHVFIKDYAENKGMLEALIDAEIIQHVMSIPISEFAFAELCILKV